MKSKIKLILLLCSLLWIADVQAQSVIDINSIKYGCLNRTDTVLGGRIFYKITKDTADIVFSSNIIPSTDSLFKYEVYQTDTLASNLLYSNTIPYAPDSVMITYPLGSDVASGDYFIKLYFKANNGSLSSDVCLQTILSSTCAAISCHYIVNGNFISAGFGGNPFELGQVQCWKHAWGTPQIGVNTTPNFNYARMWAASTGSSYKGEGITQWLPSALSSLKNYALIVEARRSDGFTVNVNDFIVTLTNRATSNLSLPVASAGTVIPSFTGQQILNSTQISTTNAWKMLGGCFTPNQSYDQIVIYPRQNISNTAVGWVDVKSVGVYDISPASYTLNINCLGTGVLGNSTCVVPTATYSWAPTMGLSNPNVLNPTVTHNSTVSTTYTVTVTIPYTGASSCIFQHVYYLNVLPSTPPGISGTQTICPGGTTTLTASGASTYTWQPTNTFGSTNIVSPATNMTYTVYSTTAQGCLSSNTVAVNIVTPTALTITAAQNVTTCPGANTGLLATGGGSGYTWYPTSATTASIVVTTTTPVIYTVTSTSTEGCNQMATVLINPISCCSVSTAITFTATSGSLNGGVFNMNGPLTLTADLTLDDITIFMGANAEIIVPNNVKFTINQCHFLGCPQMWKGIRFLGPNGSIDITKNSLIEDAITAVDLTQVTAPYNSSEILFMDVSTFNKNHTAISAASYNTNSGNYPMKMSSMVFTSRKLYTPDHQLMNPALPLTFNWPTTNTTNLKGFATIPNSFNPDLALATSDIFSVASYSTSNMEIPNSNSVAHQGIRLKDIYSTNSSYNGFRMTAFEGVPYVYSNFDYYNVFDNMHYGINAENSNLMVAHAAFQNMSQFVTGTAPGSPNLKYYDGGMGINSISTLSSGLSTAQTFSLAVGPVINGTNKSTNFFINNPYGIKTENIAYMTVAFNVFHSTRTYSAFTAGQFNAPVGRGDYAIYIKTLDYRNLNIRRNFTANIANGVVFIANANHVSGKLYAQYTGTVNIASNTFKANYGSSITASQSLKQAIATDNLMSGIALLSSANPAPIPVYINNNTIDKAFNGITVSNWNRQRVIDNTNVITLVNEGSVSTNQYGIKHINNMGDNLIGNSVKGFGTTKQRVYGIMASENKAESFWCNFTENSYIGTVFIGSQNLTKWKNNTMTTHQQAMRLDNTTIGTQGAMSQPINNTWAGSWTGAYKLFVNGIDPGSVNGNSKLYLSNVPSTSESDGTPNTFKYKTTAPQSLFYTTGSSGVSCPYTLPTPPEAPQFSGYLETLDYMVLDSLNYGTFLTGNRKNSKFAVYRALLEDTTLLATDTILQNFKAVSDSGNIGKFFAVEQYLVDGDYASADALLSSITPVDSVELGMKKMQRIYVRSKTASYDASDESDLIELAKACPAQMGIGVYQARALLNSIYDVYFEYESDCGDTNNVAYRKARGNDGALSSVTKGNFMVYPNPSDGVVYFTASNMDIESYAVTVYDISGKAIFMKEYTNGEKVNSIDLNLSNGVYLMQLTDKHNGEVHKQKFVIQK